MRPLLGIYLPVLRRKEYASRIYKAVTRLFGLLSEKMNTLLSTSHIPVTVDSI